MTSVYVYGAGAYGTALSLSALQAPAVHNVTLIGRQSDFMNTLINLRVNERYLPGVFLPHTLHLTADLNILKSPDTSLLLMACPAQCLEQTLYHLISYISQNTTLVLCAKGIEKTSGRLLSSILTSILPHHNYAVLSGPSFASEMARNLPTAVTIASPESQHAIFACETLRHARFRCYASADPIGVQIGGAVKNVLAIACGILEGCNLGQNAKAALITRGLAEMKRLGVSLGAAPETFLGLSGVGDLTLTGSSTQSRNYTLGVALGQGETLENILNARHAVTEGVATAQAIYTLAAQHQVRMPICHAVHRLLYQNATVSSIITDILNNQALFEGD